MEKGPVTSYPAEKDNNMAPRTLSRPAIRPADTLASLPPLYRRENEEEADIAKLTLEASSVETVKVIKDLDRKSLENTGGRFPCLSIPFGLNPRFYSRESEVHALEECLDLEGKANALRVVGISGLGGVGKTQLALHYANTHIDSYDVVAWIAADTQIKLTRSLCDLAVKLGLSNAVDDDGGYQASLTIRDWLNTSGKRFLLIFDNVDYIHILMQVWPACGRGSIIITSRSPSVASKRAQVNMQLLPFSNDAAIQTLNALTNNEGHIDVNEQIAASEICRLLGGLPLAIDQISEFIRDRGYSYSEFIPLYKSSAAKIHEKGHTSAEYNHTLSTVWNISLQKLSRRARTLQNLLTFFDPDSIKERLLKNGHQDHDFEEIVFLGDDLEFADAISELMAASLIGRSAIHQTLSVHRLVQAGVLDRMSEREKDTFLDCVVRMLSLSFPNTWNTGGPHQGRDWKSWETCSEVLPHVSWLLELVKTHKLPVKNPELLADLIFRTGSYLWEREQLSAAQEFVHFGLSLVFEKATAPFANAFMLLGHIAIDMAQPEIALQAYSEALTARLKGLAPDESEVGDVYDYIAYSLTELNKLEEAFEYLEIVNQIRARNELHLGATTAAVVAVAQLRAGNPQAASVSLHKAWDLQKLNQTGIEQSLNPKHGGDILLMSRIQYVLGHKKEALETASKSITIRKGRFGAKGPRVADSSYHVAKMLKEGGNVLLAAKLLRDVVAMSQGMRELDGQLARALWTLGTIEQDLGNDEEAAKLIAHAKEVRVRIEDNDNGSDDSDEAYEKLVAYLLW